MHRRSSSVSPTRSMGRRPSTSSSQLKRTTSRIDYTSPARPRQPSNPPEPPLTLLHSTTSRSLPPHTDEGHERQREKEDSRLRTTPMSTYNPRIPFSGMVHDIRARLPWYWSDWKDAWNYRVIPATWVGPQQRRHADCSSSSSQTYVSKVRSPAMMARWWGGRSTRRP